MKQSITITYHAEVEGTDILDCHLLVGGFLAVVGPELHKNAKGFAITPSELLIRVEDEELSLWLPGERE